MIKILAFLLVLILSSCGWKPSPAYHTFYKHLQVPVSVAHITESDYFVIFLVDAPHLDYTSNRGLIQTIAVHPDGRTNRDVGHAWIYLEGIQNGERVYIEGGHSGELGYIQPKYFDGVMDLLDQGDPNPIRYLWACQQDGFFQEGSGNHKPTFAARVALNEEQFNEILEFIHSYDFSHYFLTDSQCCTFVAQVAALANINLNYSLTIPIQQNLKLGKENLFLWQDSKYAFYTFGSPDILEKSLIELVNRKQAQYCLNWY